MTLILVDGEELKKYVESVATYVALTKVYIDMLDERLTNTMNVLDAFSNHIQNHIDENEPTAGGSGDEP